MSDLKGGEITMLVTGNFGLGGCLEVDWGICMIARQIQDTVYETWLSLCGLGRVYV